MKTFSPISFAAGDDGSMIASRTKYAFLKIAESRFLDDLSAISWASFVFTSDEMDEADLRATSRVAAARSVRIFRFSDALDTTSFAATKLLITFCCSCGPRLYLSNSANAG